ncbi:leucyl aminopeptidase family protein [Sphingomonas sp. KRR8]|uniref:leucyl aminopeptidase family protein n=1 Tax=Sphingomonas sp. KRR8 TaxID=2942996 RepID=UPI0020226C02|nr:leucyl aminopeptidase family protein [Sphingomonas sp. KRR8]URD61991.1 leucyl aminopeptidase family protein [Sphingomonas sp. KRR8]
MTDFAALLRPDRNEDARAIHLIGPDQLADWLRRQGGQRLPLVEAAGFEGKAGQLLILPGKDAAGSFDVLAGVSDPGALGPWDLAGAAAKLPAGTYRLADEAPLGPAGLGWLLAQHKFERFKSKPSDPKGARVLLARDVARVDEAVRLAGATALVRDLVDTPAGDMGPAELEAAARALADEVGATLTVTSGDELTRGYPMIAAVGRAATAARAPRLIELTWGKPDAPRLAVIGKGVCFDSGGLDLKPASGMRLMKKDMGGAAHALALARLITTERWPVRLHLLIPAVENAVAGDAFRPGDVLVSRSGQTVEIDNTDAEGRLILGDALTRAGEENPSLIVDFATLTGAARVALGPDLPATFVNDDTLAAELATAAGDVQDPLWRMPLWDGYDEMLKSDLADMANSAEGGMAGAVTAALFLRRFVPEGVPWAHLDTFAWRPAAKPGRPKGGEALGLRAVHAALKVRFKG